MLRVAKPQEHLPFLLKDRADTGLRTGSGRAIMLAISPPTPSLNVESCKTAELQYQYSLLGFETLNSKFRDFKC